MSFDKLKYINDYSKENYKTILLKYRKDSLLFEWINNLDNKNGYILKLIENDMSKKIYTVVKLARNVKNDRVNKELYFGEWLDEFYRQSKPIQQTMIDIEPIYIKEEPVFMSYIASSVDLLSKKYHLKKPEWINDKKYINSYEYYAFNTNISEYQKYLKKTSPKEFSIRNLYVGDNVLKRV